MTAIYNNKSFPRCLYLYVHTQFLCMVNCVPVDWRTMIPLTLPCTLHTHTHTAVVTNRVSFWNNIASLVHLFTRNKISEVNEEKCKNKSSSHQTNWITNITFAEFIATLCTRWRFFLALCPFISPRWTIFYCVWPTKCGSIYDRVFILTSFVIFHIHLSFSKCSYCQRLSLCLCPLLSSFARVYTCTLCMRCPLSVFFSLVNRVLNFREKKIMELFPCCFCPFACINFWACCTVACYFCPVCSFILA